MKRPKLTVQTSGSELEHYLSPAAACDGSNVYPADLSTMQVFTEPFIMTGAASITQP